MAIIKGVNSWELEEAIRTLVKIGIKNNLIDRDALINMIYAIEEEK